MDVCYVDMKELIKATPEYKRIKSERIEEGSGGYSIEIANASARVVKNLYEYSLARGIDLVCSEDSLPYLAVDKPSVEMDITSDIIDYMK